MIITCNPYRTLGIPSVHYIKPEQMFLEKEKLEQANLVLFPEYWQIHTLTYGLKKEIFPSLATYHLGHNKIETTRAMKMCFPKHIPYTEILANTEENKIRILEDWDFPFVAKQIKSSMGQGVFLIQNKQDFHTYTEKSDSLYIQEYIESDRDLRVIFVGEDVVDAYWRIGESGNFLHNISQGGTASRENIPAEALELVKTIALHFGINHAGFDIIECDGHFYLLEFNVFFGNQMSQQLDITTSIRKHLNL